MAWRDVHRREDEADDGLRAGSRDDLLRDDVILLSKTIDRDEVVPFTPRAPTEASARS